MSELSNSPLIFPSNHLFDLASTVELIKEFGDGNLELGMVEVAINFVEGDQDEAAVGKVFVGDCEHL